jgi:tRNA nucleotidyltransferase (CCA-adding enzyme)
LKESPIIIRSISKAKDNGSVLEILERKPEELLIFIASLSEGTTREKIIKFMKEWRFLKLPVSGEDLKKFGLKPGPVFGKLLRELTFKVVNGEIDTNDKEAQLEFLEERCKELGLL